MTTEVLSSAASCPSPVQGSLTCAWSCCEMHQVGHPLAGPVAEKEDLPPASWRSFIRVEARPHCVGLPMPSPPSSLPMLGPLSLVWIHKLHMLSTSHLVARLPRAPGHVDVVRATLIVQPMFSHWSTPSICCSRHALSILKGPQPSCRYIQSTWLSTTSPSLHQPCLFYPCALYRDFWGNGNRICGKDARPAALTPAQTDMRLR